jgi:transcription antitermination protein NusB
MGNRHKAREFTLQILYAIDLSDNSPTDVVKLFWETLTSPEEVRVFSNQLVFGVCKILKKVDDIITRYSEHWAIDRMTSVDRNILRMAVYELLCIPEIPHSVTINEAVEVGKKFGSEDSGAFVNGILDKIAKEIQEKNGLPEFDTPIQPPCAEGTNDRAVLSFSADEGGNGQTKDAPDNGNGDGVAGVPDMALDEALQKQRMRRLAIMKAGGKKKLPVGAKITIRKGDGA